MAVTTNALEALVKEAVMQQIKQKTTANVLKQSQPALTVPVGVSARHLHVTREHLDILFGKGHQLHVKKS